MEEKCLKCAEREAAAETAAAETAAAEAAAETLSPDEELNIPDCCRHKTKERSEKEYKDLQNRLSRIEGQVRGLRRMLDSNAYCTDIMTQVTAVNAALNSFNKVLLANHIRTCVREDILAGREDTVEDLLKTLQKLMK